MKTITYTPKGVCSRGIDITVNDDGIIEKVQFTGGCSGNTQGVAALCIGRKASDVVSILKGIRCGSKSTSCPAQLALALEQNL